MTKSLHIAIGSMLLLILNACAGSQVSSQVPSNGGTIEPPWTFTVVEASPEPLPPGASVVFSIRQGVSDSFYESESGDWHRLEQSTEVLADLIAAIDWEGSVADATALAVGGPVITVRFDHRGDALEIRRAVLPEQIRAAAQEARRLVREARARADAPRLAAVRAAAARNTGTPDYGPPMWPGGPVTVDGFSVDHCSDEGHGRSLYVVQPIHLCEDGIWIRRDSYSGAIVASGTIAPALMRAARDFVLRQAPPNGMSREESQARIRAAYALEALVREEFAIPPTETTP